MFILNWFREYLEIKNSFIEKQQELKYCESCETLKLQLAIANNEKEKLLNRLLEKPESTQSVRAENLRPIPLGKHGLSFNARRQMLEREDREQAKVIEANRLKNAEPIRKTINTVEELEQELGVTSEA